MTRIRNPIPTLAAVPGRVATWAPLHPVRSGVVVAFLGIVLLIGVPLANVALAGAHLYRARSIARSSGSGSSGLAQIPELHRELSAAVGDLDRAQDELGAGSDVVGSLEPVGPPTDSRWRGLVGALQSHGDRIILAQAQLDRAAVFRQRIDRRAFSGLVSPVGKTLDDFDRYLPIARGGLDTLTLVPGLLGADHPVTYILAGQNEEERRANGGYMGSLGVARIDRGDITQLDVRNSYDFSPTDQVQLLSNGSTRADVIVSYANNYDPSLVQNTYPKDYLGAFWNRATHKRDFLEGYYAT